MVMYGHLLVFMAMWWSNVVHANNLFNTVFHPNHHHDQNSFSLSFLRGGGRRKRLFHGAGFALPTKTSHARGRGRHNPQKFLNPLIYQCDSKMTIHSTSDDNSGSIEDVTTTTPRQDRPSYSDISSLSPVYEQGLYRPFVECAFQKLQESGYFYQQTNFPPSELSLNESPAKGMPLGSTVRMETNALTPSSLNDSNDADDKTQVVSYARYALLETLVPTADEDTEVEQKSDTKTTTTTTTTTNGIQVINLVVFPSSKTPLPVWGVDIVSLPGNRHLLAMDAQPMTSSNIINDEWKSWYDTHVKDVFTWGGDIPEEASDFFSPYTLWTRLQGGENATTIIQTKVWDAFCDHLDLYLQMLDLYVSEQNVKTKIPSSSSVPSQQDINSKEIISDDKESINWQERYLAYRLKNDPARPMLTSLYGNEWTERVLNEVLFPNDIIQKYS